MSFAKYQCCQVSLSRSLLNAHAEERKWPKRSIVCVYEETRDTHGVLVGVQTFCSTTHSASNGVLVCKWQLDVTVDVHAEGEFSFTSPILKPLQSVL